MIFRVLKKIFCILLALLAGASLLAHLFLPTNALPLSLPSVSARSAILLCAEDGSVFFEKNPDERLGPASTTKLMTALTVLSLVEDPDTAVKIPREAVGIEGSSIYLVAGEMLTVRELLWALLLSSANDAATALAVFSAGSVENFCEKMNALADEWGLQNTHFSNPHGLSDDDHYTTARDLASIARRVLDDPLLSGIVATYKKTIPMDGTPDARLLVNHNRLLRTYEGAIGMKTGFTKATGRTLVSAAERGGMTLIAVTLNAPDDWRDHTAMLDFGFASYECVTLDAGALTYEMPVVGGVSDSVVLSNAEPISMILPKSREPISRRVEAVSRFAYAPVSEGAPLATLAVACEGKVASAELVTTEVVASKAPEKLGFFERIRRFFGS
ncbi:MAG: D-alanyl-D-alanine carboxypeptidase [Clostridia bacterium]|nr:D-alanyl-D-alanine carboxypeptidase [Clostridia bacterium]